MEKLGLIPASALIAETITHPIDYMKTQKQYMNTRISLMEIGKNTFKTNGIRGFYPSLGPAVLRHWVYTTTRVGLYEHLRGEGSDFKSKAFSGVFAGGVSQFIASPIDLVKVKLQTQALRNCKKENSLSICKNIFREGGLSGFYFGWKPNVLRAVTVNMGELVAYDTGKQYLLNYMNDDIYCHGLASINSGFWSTLFSTPADVLKTRLMSDSKSNMIECSKNIIKHEGILSLWKGFFPIWMRLAPWQFTFWISYEQMRKLNGISSF